jgi:hypothetical protein
MVAVLFWWSYSTLTHLCPRHIKSRTGRIWVLRAAPVAPFLTMIITAYIPLSRNKTANRNLCFWNLYYCIWPFHDILGIALALFFSGVFDGISVVIRQTILQLKTQIICAAGFQL